MKTTFFAAAALLVSFETAHASTVTLNFDNLGAAGDVVNGADFGDGTLGSTDGALVLFNSNCGPDFAASCTGGDGDLGSGPSFGTTPQGLVLIVDENTPVGTSATNVAAPDDRAKGGSIIFDFDNFAEIFSVALLDIDQNPTAADVDFVFTDKNGVVTTVNGNSAINTSQSINVPGQNSYAVFDFDVAPVSKFEIVYDGSGAVAEISYSVVPLPAGALFLLSGLGAFAVARRRTTI